MDATIHGEVQRVGYRDLVQNIARRFGVKGYVENMPDGTVKVVAEGPENVIRRFIEALKVQDPPVNVESVQVSYSDPTGEFQYFKIKFGDPAEEWADGLQAIVNNLKLYIRDMRSISSKR